MDKLPIVLCLISAVLIANGDQTSKWYQEDTHPPEDQKYQNLTTRAVTNSVKIPTWSSRRERFRRCMQQTYDESSFSPSSSFSPMLNFGSKRSSPASRSGSRSGSRKKLPFIPATDKIDAVLLSTAIVELKSTRSQTYHQVRAVIDSGSMDSCVTTHLAKKLQLPKQSTGPIIPTTEDQKRDKITGFMVACNIKPRGKAGPVFYTEAIVRPKIISRIPRYHLPDFVQDKVRQMEIGELADPTFAESGPIDLLIAADLWPLIYDGRRVGLDVPEAPGLSALGSVFGWVITGRIRDGLTEEL